MMRPISPAHVVRELDALLVQRDNPDSAPLPLSLPKVGDSGWGQLPGTSQGRRAHDQAHPKRDELQLHRELAQAQRRLRAAALRPQLLRPRAAGR